MEEKFCTCRTAFDYGSDVRKVMYTTNAIEAINSSYRKVTKKGSFLNENALFKLLYLRTKELDKKWEKSHENNWVKVLNQLMVNDKFSQQIEYLISKATNYNMSS